MGKFEKELKEALENFKGKDIDVLIGEEECVALGAYNDYKGTVEVTSEYTIESVGGERKVREIANKLGLKVYKL